jgi:hypothetical protein
VAMHSQVLGGFIEKYPHDGMLVNFERFLESYALILRDAYNLIESVYRANSTLKIQIEILKEILLSIPEIRDNETFKQKFRRNLRTNTCLV